MKNFFGYLLFILLTFTPQIASSDVRSAVEPPAPRSTDAKKNAEDLRRLYKEIPNLTDKNAVKEYLQKRLEITQKANLNAEDLASPQSVSVVDVNNLNKKHEKTLSAYEKIYQESLNRAQTMDEALNADNQLDGTFYDYVKDNPELKPFVPDFPYVTIKLSDTKEIMAPAEEHIAYLLTTILIENNGMMNITEEFIFVSNNEDFPNGFFRILPKYSYSRSGSRRRLDLTLKSVTINDEAYPYKVTEIGNYLHIEPQKPLDLPTGIYTYKFNYLVDRAIWFYDSFDEFYWDITGKTLKNVVGSANAVISLPTGNSFLAQNAIVSTQRGLNPERVVITDLDANTLAFADTEALAVGEDIHLFITLPKGTMLKPDLMQQYLWLIQDYGSIIFALLSLLAIWGSYKISLKQIRRNQDKTRASLRKTPAIFRLVNSNIFDKRSLLAEMLELVAKNIADIKQDDKTAIFIKKTDNLKNLPKSIRIFAQKLFPGAETALPANDTSKLKLERAYKYLRQSVRKEYRLYSLKLNSFYLLFSIAMLICGIIATASTAINPVHTFWVITICALLMTPYILLLNIKFAKKWLRWGVYAFSGLSILYISGWLSIYTSYIYAALIITSIALIIYYYQMFSRRNGLLRNKIKETEEYKSYLQKNPELAVSARDFNTKIPYIYAFELEKKYKDVPTFDLLKQFEKLL